MQKLSKQQSVSAAAAPKSGRRRYVGMPLAIVFLACMIFASLVAWKYSVYVLNTSAEQRFARQADSVQLQIQDRLAVYANALQGGAGLFAASKSVERDEWRQYASTLNIQQRLPGILGFGFAQWVWDEDRAAYEKTVKADGFSSFAVTPQGTRDVYVPVTYLEPFTGGNVKALGFDMNSEGVRSAAILEARDSGTAVMSGKVVLVQDAGSSNEPGFLLYVPVYKNGLPHDTVAERRQNLVGFVYSPFRVRELIAGTLDGKEAPVAFAIYDGATKTSDTLMYSNLETRPVGGFAKQSQLHFAGHVWTIEFASLPPTGDQAVERLLPPAVLFGGILLSVFVFLVLFFLLTSRAAAVKLLDAREQELAESREMARISMDNAGDLIFISEFGGKFIEVNKKACESLGYSRAELLALSVPDIDAHWDAEAMKKVEPVLRTGKPLTVEGVQKRKDGATYPVEVTSTYFEIAGRKLVLSVARNITERKKYEQDLQSRTEELERLNKLMTGRETRMAELKAEIEKLKKQA